MAGIFNLFRDTAQFEKGGAVKPLSRSKTSLAMNTKLLENVGQSKPKGLSIRSNSDLNIPAVPLGHPNKNQECYKLKLTQLDNGGCPVSPRKDFSTKKLNETSNKLKDVSPKKVFSNNDMKSAMPSNGTVFKKPLPLRKPLKKIYPEPEILAPYHDMQFEFDNIYTGTIVNEFKDILKRKKEEQVVPYEDEGFESDPEQIDVKIPTVRISPNLLVEESPRCRTPELPEISDDEDDI